MVNPVTTGIQNSRYGEHLSNKSSQINQSKQALIVGITFIVSGVIFLLIGIALAVCASSLPVTFSIGYLGTAAALLLVGVILTVVFTKRTTVLERDLAAYKALEKLDSEHNGLYDLLKDSQNKINELTGISSDFQENWVPIFKEHLKKLQTKFKITEERINDFAVHKKIPNAETIAELGISIQNIRLDANVFQRFLDLTHRAELAGITAESLCREPGFSVNDIPGIISPFKTLGEIIGERAKIFLGREEKTSEQIQEEIDWIIARQTDLDALLVSVTHLQGYAGGDMEDFKKRIFEVAQSLKITLIKTATVETLKKLPEIFADWEQSWDSYWYNRILALTTIKWGSIPSEGDLGLLGAFKLDTDMDELAALLVKKATDMKSLKASVLNFMLLSKNLTSLRTRFDYIGSVTSHLDGIRGFFHLTNQSIGENEALMQRLIKEAQFLYPQVGIYLHKLIQLSQMEEGSERTLFMGELKQYVLTVAKENNISISSEILDRNVSESFVECLLIFMEEINRILTQIEVSRELASELVKQKNIVNNIVETETRADLGNLQTAYTNHFRKTQNTLRLEIVRLSELYRQEALLLEEHNLWVADVDKATIVLKNRATQSLQLYKLLSRKMEKNHAMVEARKEGPADKEQQDYNRFDAATRTFIARNLPRKMLDIYEQTPIVSVPGVLEDIMTWMTACNALVKLTNELLSRTKILMQGPSLIKSVELWLANPDNTAVVSRRESEELGDPVVKAAQDIVLHARSVGCDNLVMEIETLLNPTNEYLTAYRATCDRFEIPLEEEHAISLIPLEEESPAVEQDGIYNLFD